LEAALILGAILTYLEASRNEKFKKHVYFGIVLAIALTDCCNMGHCSIYNRNIWCTKRTHRGYCWHLCSNCAILVSFWVLNKIETKRWIEYIKVKVWQATTTDSFMVFVLLSFFTVYREGFETVLFYRALFYFVNYMELYVLAGLIAYMAVIIAVVFIIRKLGRKLPLRVLFGLTIGIGAFMSITFLGNTIREFQGLDGFLLLPYI
jgi:high-affinity iron transporter